MTRHPSSEGEVVEEDQEGVVEKEDAEEDAVADEVGRGDAFPTS